MSTAGFAAAAPPRAVLFDLDDTLFDHLGTARAALAATQAAEPALREADLDALCRHYGELLEALHPRLLAGEFTPEQARQHRFAQLLAPYGLGVVAAGAVAARHYAHYRALRQPLPGAVALVGALAAAGYRLGIVTNNRLAEQQDKLRHLGLAELLPGLVTSEEVGVTKPALRIFHVALARLGVAPAQAVLVGDSWAADVAGALAAGIRPVWLNRLGGPAPRPGVAELRSLEPLAAAYATITGQRWLSPAGAAQRGAG